MSEQLYIKYHSFDSKADPTYKETVADWFIGWRSYLKHTEIEFPEIYGGISFSATNADNCKCARFKMIDYTKHPKRWKTVLIPVTREECDLIFAEASRMAGLGLWWKNYRNKVLDGIAPMPYGNIVYGPNALKYDLIGLLSFTTRWTIIRPHSKWIWCTEACLKALKAGLILDLAGTKPDNHNPETGDELIERQYGKAA